ncbi:MAG: PilZ domain-containing protein [Polyangiaceae bacterium]
MTLSHRSARPHFRALARRSVSLSTLVVAGGGSWQRSGRIIELGLGGARVALSDTVPVGSPVALVIDAPHLWDPLHVDGSVAWVSEGTNGNAALLGVRFRPTSGTLLRTLTELLEAAAFA